MKYIVDKTMTVFETEGCILHDNRRKQRTRCNDVR